MNNTKENVEKVPRDAIECVTGITDLDNDTNLVDVKVRIAPANFLYIFDILEKNLNLRAHEVLRANDFHIMTITNLANALYSLEINA